MHRRTFFHVVLASTKKYHLRHIYLVANYQAVSPRLLATERKSLKVSFLTGNVSTNNSFENFMVNILRLAYVFIFAW